MEMVQKAVAANPRSGAMIDSLGYHRLLHQRTKALRESGKASYRICVHCKRYDDPANLQISPKPGGHVRHRECQQAYYQKWKTARCVNT